MVPGAAAVAARQEIMDNPAAYGLVPLADLNATIDALILAHEQQREADRNATVNALILAHEQQVAADRNATLAANPEPRFITYSGRITVDGQSFTGQGQFKFAFVNGDGSRTYWTHDGNATLSGEPTAGLSLTVSQGVYSIRLGDASIAGMAPLSPEVFNRLFTMHGTTMIFLAIMPLGAAFFNFIIPLQIGARDVAFPRMNAFSYWVFLFGALLMHVGFLVNAVPDAG